MSEPGGGGLVWRARVVVACLGLTALCFRQAPGLVVPDTKLDLTADPGGFLARALHLWDPHGAFGQLQNQAYGYLLPMGPFHWLLDLATVPGWVIQRLWWSVVLCVAFTGVWRLSGAMRIGVPWARFVAALLYALSPRMLGEASITSVEVWPMAMAPWVLLPLVTPAARGWRWRVSWSAAAFALVGGVNAVATGAVLILPALWFLTRRLTGRTLAAAGAWLGCVLLVSVWWLVPLVLLGRYSPPFLDWIEDASVTTGTASVFESFRGTSHWLNFLATGNGPSWPAGWLFVTSPALILQTTLVALLGLAGLATRSLRHRGFLALGAAAGLILLTLGHAGPFAGPVQDLLDGPLAAFRNTHKFELVLRLPLLLAAAHALSRAQAVHWSEVTRPVSGRVRAREPAASLLTNERPSGWWVVPFLAVCLTVSVATPGLLERMPRPEGYGAIAQHWRDAAHWLDDQPAAGTVLVVPAAGFADFTWGSTKDEPFQALLDRPLAVRDAVPLGSAGSTRWLDEIERRLGAGLGGTELRTALARAGVRFVAVRNDLRTDVQGSHPLAVHQALARSGLTRAAFFGPPAGSPIESTTVTLDERTRLPYPSIEVYDVGPAPQAELIPGSQLVTVSGGPEDVPSVTTTTAAGATVVGSDRFGHERLLARSDEVLTDGYQRREVAFGRTGDNTSAVLTADDPGRQHRGVGDYDSDPDPARTTRTWEGLAAVRASSSAADATASLRLGSGYGPQAALDGDPATRWVSGSYGSGVGEWLELRFTAARPVEQLSVTLARLAPAAGRPTTIRVDTDAGSATTRLTSGPGPRPLAAPAGNTQRVRLTVLSVDGTDGPGVGIAELTVPGLPVGTRLAVPSQPDDAVSAPEWIVLRERQPGRLGCLHQGDRPLCTQRFGVEPEDATGIRRLLQLSAGAVYTASGSVLPRHGQALERLLDQPGAVTARGTSRAVTAAQARPGAAVDRDLGTGWIAAPSDQAPALTLTLPRPRRLTGLQVLVDQNLAVSRPRELTVRVDGAEVADAELDEEGYLRFPARTGRQLRVEFGGTDSVLDVESVGGFRKVLPVGVSELRLEGADDTRKRIDPATPTGAVCGFGPEIQAGNGRIATRVRGTLGDVLAGRPLRLDACDDLPGQPQRISLGAGRNLVDIAATERFRPLEVRLAAVSAPSRPERTGRPLAVSRSGSSELTVDVPARTTDAVLRVPQNHNAGWIARDDDGRVLRPIRLDGWQQGWVLPAGDRTTVTAAFAPDRPYRIALLAGLAGILLVAGLAIATSVRDRHRARVRQVRAAAADPAQVLPWPAVAGIALIAGGFVLGWPGLLAAAVGVLLTVLPWDSTAYRIGLIGAAGLVAACWAALEPWTENGSGVTATAVQALVLGALVLAVGPLDRPGGGDTS